MLWLRGLDSTPHLSSCLVSHYGIRCILLRWVFSSWKEAAAVTCPELDYSSVDTLGATGVKTLCLMFISACVVLLICQCFSTFHEENKSHPWVSKCTRGSKRRLSFFGSFWRAVTRLSCFVGAKQNGAVREQGILVKWSSIVAVVGQDFGRMPLGHIETMSCDQFHPVCNLQTSKAIRPSGHQQCLWAARCRRTPQLAPKEALSISSFTDVKDPRSVFWRVLTLFPEVSFQLHGYHPAWSILKRHCLQDLASQRVTALDTCTSEVVRFCVRAVMDIWDMFSVEKVLVSPRMSAIAWIPWVPLPPWWDDATDSHWRSQSLQSVSLSPGLAFMPKGSEETVLPTYQGPVFGFWVLHLESFRPLLALRKVRQSLREQNDARMLNIGLQI